MKIRYSFLCLFAFVIIGFSQSKQKGKLVLENGVSEQMAIFRKQQISNVSYGLSFEIPNQREQDIISNLNLELTVSDLSQPLYLDFKEKSQNIKSVSVNGKNIAILHEKGHIVIPVESLILGKIQLSFLLLLAIYR